MVDSIAVESIVVDSIAVVTRVVVDLIAVVTRVAVAVEAASMGVFVRTPMRPGVVEPGGAVPMELSDGPD